LNSISNPIIINAIAEAALTNSAGMYLFITEPRSTPRTDEQTNAMDEPISTANLELDSAESIMVVSWVLSPNSAKNTKIKVDTIILYIFSS
jgi:hypothetical protein